MRERRDRWGDETDRPTRPVWGSEGDDTAYVPRHPQGSDREREDDPTRIVPRKQGLADRPTEFMTGSGEEDARTVPVTRRSRGGHDATRAASGRATSPGDTVLVGRTQRPRGPKATRPVDDDPMNDPPAGWLVAIAGPAQGTVATLGLGRNNIGRGPENRVSLGERDKKISAVNHCEIIYDARNRKFFVQDKDSKNLTYLDDQAVLAPSVLDALAHLRMGDTVLRFVPFCGEDFSWEADS